jgi:small subunit ribosomal protein S20
LANHKSALKRARQNTVRRLRNKATKTRVKNVVKEVRQAIEAKATDKAQSALIEAQAAIDKAAKKGVVHKKTAARKISRLTKVVNALKA